MNETQIEELKTNMSNYHNLATEIKELTNKQDKVKQRSLQIMKELECNAYVDEKTNLTIKVMRRKTATGVDEIALSGLIGINEVETLKTVHPSTIKSKVKEKLLTPSALKCIITKTGSAFISIRKVIPKSSDISNESCASSMTD